ncbi:apolipoprotein N-acyltransferase, partial [Candidatus Marinamargulisbacteria bacterium SCGC AAA071-K20]
MLSTAFPKLSISFMAYFALIPFIFDLHHSSHRSYKVVFFKAILFAFPFMLIQHYFLISLIDFSTKSIIVSSWIAYSALLSLYWGIFALLYKKIGSQLWTIPLLWTLLEYCKALGTYGNSIGQLATTQSFINPIAQLSWIGGPFLITFFIIGINTLLTKALLSYQSKQFNTSLNIHSYKLCILLAMSFYVCVYCFGSIKTELNLTDQAKIKIAIIQANHRQKEKLNSAQTKTIQHDYITLSQQAASVFKPAILFLPETITTQLNLENKVFIRQLQLTLKNNSSHILMGTPRYDSQKSQYFNSIVSINKNGIDNTIYDKVHLFPFGEYWPYKNATKWIGFGHFIPENDFSAAQEATLTSIVINHSELLFGHAICLESMYPWHLKKAVKKGANIFFVAANHAWFL